MSPRRPLAAWLTLALTAPLGAPTAHAQPPPCADDDCPPVDSEPTDDPPEVIVVEGRSTAETLRRSAAPVQAVDLADARLRTADLGEVLARVPGVGVRRTGGLGSETRFSLHGLADEQIRFFIDGVPLRLAGYPFGLANVPIDLVDRVEIYSGVVPARFGADALGGAVELVTDDDVAGTHGSMSYQMASFNTHRATLGARHQHAPSGLFARVGGFFDHSDNDYPITVEVSDPRGRLSDVEVERFHDAYTAGGGSVELGLVDRPWARRLILRGFYTAYHKELQSNPAMSIPYGEAEYAERAYGATLRFHSAVYAHGVLEAIVGHTHTASDFVDLGDCVYDWFGACVHPRYPGGEVTREPRDQTIWNDTTFGRVRLEWQPGETHTLRLTLAPTFVLHTGDDRERGEMAYDRLDGERTLLTHVLGLEHEVDLLDDRIQNIAFAKHYLQSLRGDEQLGAGIDIEHARDSHRVGLGDAIRVHLTDAIYAKASYEWSTRLPDADEVFGNGRFIEPNLALEPEVSHNANLGLTYDARHPIGHCRAQLDGVLRAADDLIVLIGDDRSFSYQNIYRARSLGLQGALAWTAPGDRLALDGNITWLDFRNTTSDGNFGTFEGDRIPNRPWLFANAAARFALDDLALTGDALSLVWRTRYVHPFFRGWESLGDPAYKQSVPARLIHGLALTWRLDRGDLGLSLTAEVHNLTDAIDFDFFGAQRPGRSFALKTTAAF